MIRCQKIFAFTCLLLMSTYSPQTEAIQISFIQIYPTKRNKPLTFEQVYWPLCLVGGIAGIAIITKMCYDYFHWTDEQYIKWAEQKITSLNQYYAALPFDATLLNTNHPAFVEQLSNFGLTIQDHMDDAMRAVAPLHNAAGKMYADFRTLCSIIKECGKRELVGNGLIEAATMRAQILVTIMNAIRETAAYKKEVGEIEKLKNSRESLHLQHAYLRTIEK